MNTAAILSLLLAAALAALLPCQAGAAEGGPAEVVPPAEQERMLKIAQGDLGAAANEAERFYALGPAAKKALEAAKTEEARTLAEELERLTPKFTNNWNYGNAIQDANQVLGRIALAAGDVEAAKKRLLASADSKGSPQLNSFGPDLQLARELLAKGERDVVLQYLELCKTFWKMGAKRLAAWSESLRKGETPGFGLN